MDKVISEEFIDGEGAKIVSFISGKSTNSPELVFIYEQILNAQCEKDSWFCLFG